jgi:subtilase family serine protease
LPHLSRVTVVTVALAGSLGAAAAGSAAAFGSASPDRVTVANAQPALSAAKATGAPSAAQRIEVKLYLADRNAADLAALVAKVSTPGTSSYGAFLTEAQFRARYAPSAADVAAVKAFATGSGLKVTSVPANHLYVAVSGSVAAVQKAFGTSLKNYSVDGQTIRAAAGAATIPAALKGKVTAVSGLASISSLMKPTHVVDGAKVKASSAKSKVAAKAGKAAPPPDAFVNAPPCSAYFGQKVATTAPSAYGKKQPYVPCGYTPSQLQGAYGLTTAIKAGLAGKGVTVAITDAYAAPTILEDANTYATKHGQKAFASGQFSQVSGAPYRYGYDDTVNGDQCGEQGWYGEETLDVEAVHAVAPSAKVKYVASSSCDNGDFVDTLNKVVDGHLADIVTNSWGGIDESNGSPELDQAYTQVFQQAAATGIGFYFSSGDNGDGSAVSPDGNPTPESPANNPYVTAVGGTSLEVGKTDKRILETGWSTSRSALDATGTAWTPAPPGNYQYGAGGGTSSVFTQPAYQKGVVPAALATRYSTTPARVVPDVSAIADPNTGMLVGETQTFPDGSVKYSEYRIGGTSLASPIFAGVMAVADQVAHHPHGFANPALYSAYRTNKILPAFYDSKPLDGVGVVRVDYANTVDATDGTITSLRTLDYEGPGTILTTEAGYDDITGIGSPNGLAFLASLAFRR